MSLLDDLERNVFFVLAAVLLAFSLYQTIGMVSGTSVPVVSVVSDSMVPTFYRGDMVIVDGMEFSAIEEDDIVVFSTPYMPMPVIHRVINRSTDSIDTRGDNNAGQVRFCVSDTQVQAFDRSCSEGEQLVNIEDGVQPDQIMGRVEFIIPYLGYAKLLPTCAVRMLQYPSDHPAVNYAC